MDNASLASRYVWLAVSLTHLGLFDARADTLQSLWSLTPDADRLYVTTANMERGIAYNPVSKNVLLVSRAGGPKVYVLDAATGDDGSAQLGEPRTLSPLDLNGENAIEGGTFTLNLVGAGADGAVYACNLATTLDSVRIYRWANDQTDTPVSVAYRGDPLAGIPSPGSGQDIRFGDAFAARGAGPATQLAQSARNGKYIVLYTTTDGVTFTHKTFVAPSTVAGKIGLGLAFGGGNTLWAKLNGNALQRLQFDLASGQLTLLNEVSTGIVGANLTGIGFDPVHQRLAAVDYVAHTLSVFDAADPAGLIAVGDPLPFPTANANVNGTGAVAVTSESVYALESNNGVLAVRIERSVVVDPPVIATQPAGATVYEGASHTFAVAAQGTPPFEYQWFFREAPLAGATSAQLTISPVTSADAGAYKVTVRNSAETVTSTPATLTVRAPLNTGVLQPLWTLAPGDRPYLTGDNAQRGLAWNPVSGNLLLASRSPSNVVAVLDAATGAEKHRLRTTGADDVPIFLGGTFAINLVGVADDGVVYVANLVTDASAAAFQIYRWDDDSADAVPTIASLPADLSIAERWGDTLDVRGKGATTQILLGARGISPQEGRKFAVLTTTDGYTFGGRVYPVDDLNSTAFGLGIAFGPGNTVFGTANGQPLVHVGFNPADGSAAVLHRYEAAQVPLAASFLGFDAAGNLLASVAMENPDNVLLYDLAEASSPALLDQRLIVPKQSNANGTGALDFGGNRLFVLDTNHGLRAFTVQPGGSPAVPGTLAEPAIAGGNFRFALGGSAGRDYLVQKTSDFRSWTEVGSFKAPATVSDPVGAGPTFYRAVAR